MVMVRMVRGDGEGEKRDESIEKVLRRDDERGWLRGRAERGGESHE